MGGSPSIASPGHNSRQAEAVTSRAHDREIIALALPALGALVAEPLYVLADTAVVGRLGTLQLDGLALAAAVLASVLNVFIFLAYGTTAAVSRLIGAGDEGRAASQAVQALWLAGVSGIFVSGLVWVLAPDLLSILGGTEAARAQALIYLRISAFGLPAMFLTMAGVGYLRGQQNTRLPLMVTAATAVFNLVLELVLIVGFDFGIGASALSTVLAQIIAALVYVWKVAAAALAEGAALGPAPSAMGTLLRIGGDLIVRTIALRGIFTITTAVAARLGEVDLAAHHIAFEFFSFVALALDAIAIAGQALVGKYLGANDRATTREVAARMLQWGVGFGVIAGVLVAVTSPLTARIFTTDAEVVRLTGFILILLAFLLPFGAVAFVLDGILIGAGDMRFLAYSMVGVAAVYWPLAFVLMRTGAGIGWLWVGLIGVMAGRCVALGARYRTDHWLVTGASAT